MQTILLIEDEVNVVSFLQKGLREDGYNVLAAYDGQMGLDLLAQHEVDLVVLDLVLPIKNGYEVCKQIRSGASKSTPIIMLTALGTTENVVKGLDTGADDYLVKPFKFSELSARIRALLRRKNFESIPNHLIEIADLQLDTEMKTAMRKGSEIKLTSTEYRLLEYFMLNPRKVLSRIRLLEHVWDINFSMETNVVDVYVNYLRNKIDKGHEVKLIHTVIGMGYIMKEGEAQ